MKWLGTGFCQLAILLVAFRWSASTSGFLVIWLGSALLLDRFVFRVFPWAIPISRTRELMLRGGWFTAGAVGSYLMRPGIVPVWEAVYRGAILCLVGLLLDSFVGLLAAWFARSCEAGSSRRMTLGLWGAFGGGLAVVVPVVVTLHPLHTVPKRSPAAFGLPFDDIRFRTADGVELGGWVVPHAQARGNVIFCHGHGRNRGHVAGLLQTFHDLRLNVLAFDFRGHGDSQGHTSTFGDREVLDLLAAESYLRQRFPGQPLFLVGVSLGAAVSLQALPTLPDVRGVWSEGSFSRLSDVVGSQFTWLPRGLRGSLTGLYRYLAWLDCGFWAPRVSPLDSLRDVQVPIYFCHAMQDELVPFREGVALFDGYAGPKRHWWVANATHYDVRQHNHEEYLARLRTFLEELLSDK
jgi:alpha-beta hydrolase superfamily lysophospholipase